MFKKNKYSYVADDTKLWRYLSLSKFLDLLDTSALYFRRIDCFEDPLEARQPGGAHSFAVLTQNPWQVFTMQCVDKQLEIYRNMTFANCWHMNPSENPDMWKNYVMRYGNEGVAKQTCFSVLVDSFCTDRVLTNLKMEYIDYRSTFLDYSYPNYPKYISIKDKKFEYENELRIITLEESYPEYNPDEPNEDCEFARNTHKGEHIGVDLQKLFQCIYLSPNSTERFKLYVEELLQKYNLHIPIVKSI